MKRSKSNEVWGFKIQENLFMKNNKNDKNNEKKCALSERSKSAAIRK